MLGHLKNKIFTLQEEITASVKHLSPLSQSTSNSKAHTFNAGEEILEYWQIQWETIHMAQDQNGRAAGRCDRAISASFRKIQHQWELVLTLQNLLGQIPKLNEDIKGIITDLGKLETVFNDVEISLLALEDTIDARELQEKQLEQRFQVAMFQERRRAEYNDLSNRLQSDYQKKKSEYERTQMMLKQERQREAMQRFDADMRQFKNSGRLLQVPQVHDPDASLESVDLNDDDVGNGGLESFLAEESHYDVSPLPLDDVTLNQQLSSGSSSTWKDDQLNDSPCVDDQKPATEELGAISRTESLYYTPDDTTEKLQDLTLE